MADEVIGGATATPDAGAATATPAAAPATPVPATQGTPAQQQATPAATQTPAIGAQGPEGWVPPYRLRETREQAERQYQQQLAAYQAQSQQEVQRLQQQLQALVGVQPPQNPEVQAVQNQFSQLYPGLSKLEARAQDLLGLIDQAGDFESAQNHIWTSYGRQTMDRIYSSVEKTLGTNLNEEGKRFVHGAFTSFVSSSPEMTARYQNDPSLADEWVQSFAQAFISPAQRAASATVQGRAQQVQQLPNVAGGAIPQVAQPPKPKDMDERAVKAWAQFQQQRG